MNPHSDMSDVNMILTEIKVNDRSMDALYKYYPKDLFPKSLKKPSGKARKCAFEHITNDVYDPEANMIAFGTSADRLPYWVRAAWLYIYDYLGTKGNMNAQWEHDPVDKNKLTSVNMLSKKDKINPLAYKLTIFISTGTIQVQGNDYNLFVSSHFKVIITLVNKLMGICENKKYESTDADQTIPKGFHDQEKPNTPSRTPV